MNTDTYQQIAITSSEQWHELRKNDVTASEIASLFGISPYKSKLKLYCEKAGKIEVEFEDNPVMQRGRWAEIMFVPALKEQEDMDIIKANVYCRDEAIRLGATPDYFTLGTDIVETKICSPDVFEDWGQELPMHYILQHQAQYAVMPEKTGGGIALMIMCYKHVTLKWFPIDPDPLTISTIRQKVAEFWDDVKAGNEPTPDFAADTDVIKRLNKYDAGVMLDFTGDSEFTTLINERMGLKKVVKDAEGKLEEMDNKIKFRMGDAAIGLLNGYKINYKSFVKPAFTVRESTQRPLKITQLKGE